MTVKLFSPASAGLMLLAAVVATPVRPAAAVDTAPPPRAVKVPPAVAPAPHPAAARPPLAPLPRTVVVNRPKTTLEYNRDVRPILAENCFACHGPDSAARKADLRLDRRDDALEAKVIVPGDPKGSALVERIFADDPAEVMPPPKAHKKLT